MVDVNGHKRKIAETMEQLKTATGYRRNDLKRYLTRLNRELAEYRRLQRA